MDRWKRWKAALAILACGAAVAFSIVSTRARAGLRDDEREEGGQGQDVVIRSSTFDFEEAVRRASAEESAKLSTRAEDEEDKNRSQMEKAVLDFSPYYKTRGHEVRRLVSIISNAATRHGIDPWLALSIAYRESSLRASVGTGKRRGALGEVGYFQIMPRGYAMRVCGEGRPMTSARANADTAMCYLDHVREICGEKDPSIYVAAYSMRNCPSNARNAMGMTTTKRAREILCRMAGENRCNEIWPRRT